jgi:hypothetical protein
MISHDFVFPKTLRLVDLTKNKLVIQYNTEIKERELDRIGQNWIELGMNPIKKNQRNTLEKALFY